MSDKFIRIRKILFILMLAVIAALNSDHCAATEARCPSGMVFIPGGSFISGTTEKESIYIYKLCNETMGGCYLSWFQREVPPEKVYLDSFCIDRYEYPNVKSVKPDNNSTWERAANACASNRKRLCGEYEWERACRGPSYFEWSYGYKYSDIACNVKSGYLKPSGSRSDCKSVEGVFDMNGNVSEWVYSNPKEGTGRTIPADSRPAKGGSFRDWPVFSRCSFRDFRNEDDKNDELGFRCCANPLF